MINNNNNNNEVYKSLYRIIINNNKNNDEVYYKFYIEFIFTHPLEENEIISFVDETLILQRWLNAMNLSELKRQNSLYTLKRFVRKAFLVN